MHRQLVFGDCVPEFAFHLHACDDLFIHVAVKEFEPVPAIGFGRVTRQIGVFQQPVRIHRIVRIQRDADTGSSMDGL